MKQSRWRLVATIVILIVSVAAFSYYFATHPEVRRQLHHTSLLTIALLLVLYVGEILALALVTLATLRLCKIRLTTPESFVLTGYSSIINFFGPLQSGPAFRALYLKKKHGLKLRNYTAATFLYYFVYALISGTFLLYSVIGWWLVAGVVVVLGLGFAAKQYSRWQERLSKLDLHAWYYLAGATLLQLVLFVLIYYVELRTVLPSVTLGQAITYAGAANFALFVSLTPGAIGFRESFLLFSQHLHHVSNTAIIAANIIDRTMYVIVLLGLALVLFTSHARRRLSIESE